jgi:hypothetical protein
LLYEDAKGVWLDEFKTHWINESVIMSHNKNMKKVCIVSPELHKKNHIQAWGNYKKINKDIRGDVFLCTDFPEEARVFFNE